MAQLVGQLCVHCRTNIGSELESRFCLACGCPGHDACTTTALEKRSEGGGCATCGAPKADVEPRREAAEQAVSLQANSKRRRKAGCLVLGGGGLALYWLIQLAFLLGGYSRQFVSIQDAIVGLVLSVVLLIVGFVKLRQSGRV